MQPVGDVVRVTHAKEMAKLVKDRRFEVKAIPARRGDLVGVYVCRAAKSKQSEQG